MHLALVCITRASLSASSQLHTMCTAAVSERFFFLENEVRFSLASTSPPFHTSDECVACAIASMMSTYLQIFQRYCIPLTTNSPWSNYELTLV